MNTLIAIITSLLGLVPVCFISEDRADVIVYEDSIGVMELDRFYQDLKHEKNLYEVYIIDKSPLRFKVKYNQLGDDENVKEGWVEKEQCGVYLRQNGYTEDGIGFLHLYTSAECKEYLRLYNVGTPLVPVVDYSCETRCLQVCIRINETEIVGWINRFCPYIYNSCT